MRDHALNLARYICLGAARRGLMLVLLLASGTTASNAQAPSTMTGVRSGVFVGTDVEDYLRVLQTLGLVPLYPWSIRGFSPHEVDRLRPTNEAHPWQAHVGLQPPTRTRGLRWESVPVRFDTWYNTAFPFGMNDGAVWRGRGATAAVQGGVAVRWGPVSLALIPAASLAENKAFTLAPNGQTGRLQFADPLFPPFIDRPQRFGDRAYAQVDLGQSALRLDVLGVAAGISTADQWWGPMHEYPSVLGNNAGGFPHVFVGASRPINIWIGRFHSRAMYGRLEQTAYTNIGPDSAVRLAASLVAVFLPRGVPGLELGAARFFHVPWTTGGIPWNKLTKPFEGILKASLPRRGDLPNPDSLLAPGASTDNQLAAVFARWVFPPNGFELYGEYGREDHNWDMRDLLLEPDHSAGYGVGFSKAWRRADRGITVLRGEVMNHQLPISQLHRPGGESYLHIFTRQGHTHRGQLLAGIGPQSGGAARVAVERYSTRGRSEVFWSRVVRRDPTQPTVLPTVRTTNALDVQHLLGAERSLVIGRLLVHGALTAVVEYNRDLRRDARNVEAAVGATWSP